jgi:hypothetical protein
VIERAATSSLCSSLRNSFEPRAVSRFENGTGTTVATLPQIELVLEKEGIIFLPADDSGGPGVRLRKGKEDN